MAMGVGAGGATGGKLTAGGLKLLGAGAPYPLLTGAELNPPTGAPYPDGAEPNPLLTGAELNPPTGAPYPLLAGAPPVKPGDP